MQRLIDECNLTQERPLGKGGQETLDGVELHAPARNCPTRCSSPSRRGLSRWDTPKPSPASPDETQLRVLKRCIEKGLSVRQVEELVRSLTEPRGKAPAQNVEDEEYPESYSRLVEQLEKFFSQEISIKRSKNGGGRIVIGFTDDRDIEQFIERFSRRRSQLK